ncbi:MAG: phosphotransferase family protein [Burkholderiaceae bacterium]
MLSELARLFGSLGAIVGLRRLSGGASMETWSFDLVFGDGKGEGDIERLILRRAPVGAEERATGGGSAGLAAEAVLLGLAARAGVPVPKVRTVLRPEHGLGDGFVMQRIEGESLGHKIVREARYSGVRKRLAFQCGAAMARIHQVPIDELPALRLAPAMVELEQYRATHRRHGTVKPVFELAFHWLQANAPAAPSVPVLVHGDFRNGNMVVGSDGLQAVLDWELAHRGDGMEDLGWISVNSWRFGCNELAVGGFGTKEDLFAGYESAGGTVDAKRVHYWEVLGTLKWGVICEAMAHAHLSGAERNVEKAAIGRRASETEIDLLNLLDARETT